MKNKWTYIIIAVVVVAILAAGGIYYFSSSNDYVAKVDGQKVTRAEYTFFLKSVQNSMEVAANLLNDTDKKAFWASKINGENAVDVAKDKALDEVKEVKIELIKAKQSGLILSKKDADDTDASVDNMLKSAAQQNQSGQSTQNASTDTNATISDSDFKAQYGISIAEYKTIMRNFRLAYNYIQQEEGKMNITDAEVKNLYDTKLKDSVDQVTVRHILFPILDPVTQQVLPKATQDANKKQAEDILARIKAGEDMAKLAPQYSQDPSVAQNQGVYTFGINDGYVQEFKDFAFKAKVGDLQIVTTKYGYHVMRLESRTTYDQVKDKAKKAALDDKFSQQVEQMKKDPQFNVVKNTKIFNSINIG